MWDTHSVVFYFYISFVVIGLWGVAQAWLSQTRTETIHPFKAFVHLLVFYLSYLLFPLFFFSLYAGWSGYYSLHEAVFIFGLSCLLIYTRFIEPHHVGVKTMQYQ